MAPTWDVPVLFALNQQCSLLKTFQHFFENQTKSDKFRKKMLMSKNLWKLVGWTYLAENTLM